MADANGKFSRDLGNDCSNETYEPKEQFSVFDHASENELYFKEGDLGMTGMQVQVPGTPRILYWNCSFTFSLHSAHKFLSSKTFNPQP